MTQVLSQDNSPPSLYSTTRVSLSSFSYELTFSSTGDHVVRLHFFPFSSPTQNLFSAKFKVFYGDLLLHRILISDIDIRYRYLIFYRLRMSVLDIDIGTRYRHPETDIRHMDIGIEHCRYRVLFRTVTVLDTVTVRDTSIWYRYLNGRTLPSCLMGMKPLLEFSIQSLLTIVSMYMD